MGKGKTQKIAADPDPAPVKSDDPEEEFQDVTKAQAVLGTLSAAYPVLTGEDIDALSALTPSEKCAELGSKTRAKAVLGNGVRWTVLMHEALQAYPSLLADYHPKRFAYFLDRLGVLAKTIQADEVKRGRKGAAKGSALAARSAALETRGNLIRKMKRFAGEREAERAELAAVQGTTDTDDNLSKSMIDIAKLGKSWLGRKDRASEILLEIAGLDQTVIDNALAFARALTDAVAKESMTPSTMPKDSPEVNIIEGQVLYEMKEVMRQFAKANAKSKVVPRLVPSPATRHVLARKANAAAGDDEEEEEEPPVPETAGSEASKK
jgi:hypothetical protein